MIKDANLTAIKTGNIRMIESYMNAVGKETVSDICVTITNKLQDACAHVGDVYLELE